MDDSIHPYTALVRGCNGPSKDPIELRGDSSPLRDQSAAFRSSAKLLSNVGNRMVNEDRPEDTKCEYRPATSTHASDLAMG